jgi:hypothetical protein
MHIQVDIGFEQLLELIKNLPGEQLDRLKEEIEKNKETKNIKVDKESFLLSGPVFTDEQIEDIIEARKAINKWRTS